MEVYLSDYFPPTLTVQLNVQVGAWLAWVKTLGQLQRDAIWWLHCLFCSTYVERRWHVARPSHRGRCLGDTRATTPWRDAIWWFHQVHYVLLVSIVLIEKWERNRPLHPQAMPDPAVQHHLKLGTYLQMVWLEPSLYRSTRYLSPNKTLPSARSWVCRGLSWAILVSRGVVVCLFFAVCSSSTLYTECVCYFTPEYVYLFISCFLRVKEDGYGGIAVVNVCYPTSHMALR